MARQGERFLTTVLFTDIVGSTELAAELGDRAWRDLLEQHHAVVRAALRRHGGRELDTAGDGFFATFDAPADAVGCALDVSAALADLGLRIRVGVHVGEVEQIGRKVGGIAVPIGARIMSAAGPGEVLVSTTVRDLAAGAGLAFADRGTHVLKGIPGAWRLYAVERAGSGPSPTTPAADERARRAAAVRRARDRPIWRRRPRVVLGAALLLAVALSTAVLAIWNPWRPAALTAVADDAVGIIDPSRNAIVAELQLDGQPGGVAVGGGSVWVTSTGTDTVRRIDPVRRVVIDRVEVGAAPLGVTVGHGSVWVANSAGRSVTRIDAVSGRVVDTLAVGNGPRTVAAGEDGAWVSNASDGTVVRLDASGGIGSPVGVGLRPGPLLVHDGSLWVASEDAATVMRLDASTGDALATPIPVGARPVALAADDAAVWVANAGDGTLSRIDPGSNRVVDTVDLEATPTSLFVDGTGLWIGDAAGFIHRLRRDDPERDRVRIATGSVPQAMTMVDGELWVTTRASTSSHQGGTLQVVSELNPVIDRVTFSYAAFTGLTGDSLVGFARVGGVAGSRIVPALATSVPRPTDGGLTWSFQLRDGLRYSDGTPVRASHFRRAVERAFQVADAMLGSSGPYYFGSLLGADRCADAPVPRCDLSDAVMVDDTAGRITFRLARPDPDFLYKLASAFSPAIPLPPSVPDDAAVTNPYPVTGPYQIETVEEDEIRLVRNPHFRSWDPVNRPAGYVDEIVWRWGISPPDQVRLVRDGDADYLADSIDPMALPELQRRYSTQLHRGPRTTTFVFLNTRLAPFDRLEVRQAVALAVDRAHIAELRGGPGVVGPTCQVLPPNFPGYEPYCPFTEAPGPGGQWTGPDLERARELVQSSGTAGARISVGPFRSRFTPIGEHLTAVLRDLGYDAAHEIAIDDEHVATAVFEEQRVAVGGFEWFADFPAPDTFLAGFTCAEADGLSNYCDPTLDAAIAEARALQATDPPAAIRRWAEVDRMVTDLALWVPLVNEGSDFVSARVGNYQYNVAYGVLLDQVWIR